MQNAAATMKAAQGGASPTDAAAAGVAAAAAPAPAPAKQNTAAPASAGGYAQSATAADNNPAPTKTPDNVAPTVKTGTGGTLTTSDGKPVTSRSADEIANTGAFGIQKPSAEQKAAGDKTLNSIKNFFGFGNKPAAPAAAPAGASNAASNAANAALTGGASVPAGAAKPAAPSKQGTAAGYAPAGQVAEEKRIKSFSEYLQEAELFEDTPSTGDVFEIEIAREEIVLESFVVGYMDDGIVVEADDTMMRILEHVGYLTENPTNMPPATSTTSPIHGGNDREIDEAEYQGRNVPLGKPMKGDVKKSKVYVKNAKGNVVKVNFGDPNMKIKKSNPKRRKSFRARHNCANPGPRTSARYWSCRAW
jgi:hypothetical protein